MPYKELNINQKVKLCHPWPNESQLWNDFKSGSKQALSHIYNNYFNVLYNYGCKIKKDRDLIEDCIQDLFFELWKNKENFSATDSIKFYLLKALRIKIFKELKKQSKHFDENRLSDNFNFNLESSYETQLINEQLSIERKEQLSYVLSKLSKRQKEAIFLKYFEDLNSEEIASIMSMNQQSVHNLIYRTMIVLKENLNPRLTFILFLIH